MREPPTEWTFPTNGSEPVRGSRGVFVVDADEASVSLVDAATGTRIARLSRPGVTFSRVLAARGGGLVLAEGSKATRAEGTLTRIDPEKGTVMWHADDRAGEVSLGSEGSGISESSRTGCTTSARDVATGKRIAKSFRDSLMHMHEHGDMAAGTMCRRATWLQLARGDVTLLAREQRRSDAQLVAVTSTGATKYEIDTGDAHARLVHADAERATFLLLGSEIVALRLVVSTGQVLWRRTLAGADTCGRDDRGPFYAETVLHEGRARSVLVRACATAELFDLASGASGWKKAIGSDVAVIGGVMTVPWDEDGSMPATQSPGARVFAEDGRELARVTMPTNAHEVTSFAGGLLVTTSKLDGAAMLDLAGRVRWQAGVTFGNAFPRDDRFVLLQSGTTAQITVHGATGDTFVVRGSSPWVVGKAGPLWLTTREKPAALVAVRP